MLWLSFQRGRLDGRRPRGNAHGDGGGLKKVWQQRPQEPGGSRVYLGKHVDRTSSCSGCQVYANEEQHRIPRDPGH